MLRTIIIGAGSELTGQIEKALEELGRFALLRSINRYPEAQEIERLLLARAPEVIFLCADALPGAVSVWEAIQQTMPGMPVVAFGRDTEPQVLLRLMKAGVREFVPAPFRAAELREVADRVEEQLVKNPPRIDSTDLMFSFLPAKPGVGTSTIALNLSVAMSREPDTKVLLMDFDLNSGLLAFMLKLPPSHSILDAVMRSEDLDENLWSELVTVVGGLHVLPAGRPEPGVRIEPVQVHRLLSFARRQYRVLSVDLSGNMEKYSIELMQESRRIFLVTTPEIPPLHLARERYRFLRDIDLGDRVSILLNRWVKQSALSVAQIEDLLEVPVHETFPNNYAGVHRALVAGKPVAANLDLGRQFAALAHRILNPDKDQPKRSKRKFLETFSILPGKYSLSR